MGPNRPTFPLVDRPEQHSTPGGRWGPHPSPRQMRVEGIGASKRNESGSAKQLNAERLWRRARRPHRPQS